MENQSRRENVIIRGLEESDSETWQETENKVRDMFKESLKIKNADKDVCDDRHGLEADGGIAIERAHRIGRLRSGSNQHPRPIVVKFTRFKHRQLVLDMARANLSKTSVIQVKEDFSERVRLCRRQLGSVMMQLIKAQKKAKMSFDKLVYEGKTYRYDSLSGFLKCDSDSKLYEYSDRCKDLIAKDDHQVEEVTSGMSAEDEPQGLNEKE